MVGEWTMNDAVFFHAFEFNRSTLEFDIWKGVATPEAIKAAGLAANLSYPLYGDARLAVDGGTYRHEPKA
jgi:hypothetical protein